MYDFCIVYHVNCKVNVEQVTGSIPTRKCEQLLYNKPDLFITGVCTERYSFSREERGIKFLHANVENRILKKNNRLTIQKRKTCFERQIQVVLHMT